MFEYNDITKSYKLSLRKLDKTYRTNLVDVLRVIADKDRSIVSLEAFPDRLELVMKDNSVLTVQGSGEYIILQSALEDVLEQNKKRKNK